MTTAATTRRRVHRDLVRLAHRGLELDDFAHAAITLLRRAVPGEGTCLLTLDPATLLPTGEVVDGGLPQEAMPRMTEIELQEPDFNKFASLARSTLPGGQPQRRHRGRLDRSRRQRELRGPSGFADELRVAVRDENGAWGALTVLRQQGSPNFTSAEVRFAASLTGVLAGGVRRSMLTERGDGDADADIGLLVLAPDGTIELRDRNAERWLGLLATDVDVPPVVRVSPPAPAGAVRPAPPERGAHDRQAVDACPWIAPRRRHRCTRAPSTSSQPVPHTSHR